MIAEEKVRPAFLKGLAQSRLIGKGRGLDAKAGVCPAAGKKRCHHFRRKIRFGIPEREAARLRRLLVAGEKDHAETEQSGSDKYQNTPKSPFFHGPIPPFRHQRCLHPAS